MAAKRPPNTTQTLPNGVEVEYWDAIGVDGLPQQRRYRIDGEKFTSISTVAGIFDKPALTPAAVKLQEAGAIALAADGVDLASLTQPELRSLLVERGLHYDSVWQVARDRGDLAHDHLLHLIRDGKVAKRSDYEADIWPWIQAGMRFVLDHRPQPIACEYIVASAEHRVAGRADLFARMRDDSTARVDFKTVTEWKYRERTVKGERVMTDELLPPYDENIVQIAGYELCSVASGYDPAERKLIVRLGPDGRYDVFESVADESVFLGALGAYRARQVVRQPGSAQVELAA